MYSSRRARRKSFYQYRKDPHQLTNVAADPKFAEVKKELQGLLDLWAEETRDSTPADLSQDSFDRETGDHIHRQESKYRGTSPGEDRGAAKSNASGPK